MNKFSLKVIIAYILVIFGLLASSALAQAQMEPKAVSLASFNIQPLNNAARITWVTGTELGTLGFFLKRGPVGGPYQTLTHLGENGVIYATGSPTAGDSYSVTDNQVQNGQTYTYILFEVETSGAEIEHEETLTTVTIGIPPTNTPIVAGGSGSGGPTATPRPTTQATVTATATNAPHNNATAAPHPVTATAASRFVTITPRPNQNASTAVPTATSSANNQPSKPTATFTPPDDSANNANPLTLVDVVSAQAEEPEAIAAKPGQMDAIAQEGYPEAPPPVEESTAYPEENNANSMLNAETTTPLPAVIGGDQGYINSQIENTEPTSASNSQGTLFLWLGFIVALLIFVTGLIGAILLFVRKAN